MIPTFPAKTAIFDIDGTLVDSRDLHVFSWQQALAEAGFNVPEGAIQNQMGRRKPEIVRALTAQPSAADDLVMPIVHRKEELYQRKESRLKALPGSTEIIRRLHRIGVTIVLATSATRPETIQHIGRLGIGAFIDAFVSAEDVVRSKPDPEIVEVALERTGSQKESAVVIGDSPHDITSAVAAQVRAIGVLTGGYSRKQLEEAGAWLVFADLIEMEGQILRGPQADP